MLAFLRDLAKAGVRQWTSKVLVLGEATVGKTSLTKQLTGGLYDQYEGQTHGVHVEQLDLPHPDGQVMRLSVWDFGGQLEYRATQRFYLTDRSLFVLVWNARARWRDGKLPAWLDVITARAPHSPVLIVGTHADDASAATLPQDLAERYPQIRGTYRVDARTGRGIEQVSAAVASAAAALPLMGAPWPKSWADARDALRAMDGNTATTHAVWQAMERCGVQDPDGRRALASALHDLGEIVFFPDDRELSQKVILHPAWLDARITAVLDSEPIAQAHGVMTRVERERLWGDLDDPDLLDRLIRMMERFDLAYRIGDAHGSEDVALVVERLGDARPPEVAAAWQEARRQPGARQIGLIYKLASRQAGIPTWFIAREHRYTTGLHWSHGVLLADRDPDNPATALLVDDGSERPTITLSVAGALPVGFLSVLTEAFDNIIEDRYPGLVTERRVPCACRPSHGEPCTHSFALDELKLFATDPDPDANRKVWCPLSRTKLDARTLLDGLPGTSPRHDALRHDHDEQNAALHRIESQLDALNGIRALTARRTHAGIHCPSLFAVDELGRSGVLRRRRLRVSLWCEWPYAHGPHPLDPGVGVYQIASLPDGLRAYLPFLAALTATLSIGVPLIAPGLAVAGVLLTDRVKGALDAAPDLLDKISLPDRGDPAAPWKPAIGRGPIHGAQVEADFRALRTALEHLDPHQTWGGLSAVARPEDHSIVYLCRHHARELEYPYRSGTDNAASN